MSAVPTPDRVVHDSTKASAGDGLPPATLHSQALAVTLDNFAVGIVIVTDENRILHANRAALQMFARGRPVRSVNGRLSAPDATAIAQLGDAISLALQGDLGRGAGIGVALAGALREPAIAHVLPLGDLSLTGQRKSPALAVVFVVSVLGEPVVNLSAVAACLGLTPRETRLVEKLEAGATLPEAAGALGIADTTAKTHLTHIFSKAGVTRQVELMTLIHRLVPPIRKPAVG